MDKVYINGMAQVSNQSPLSEDWFDKPIMYTEPFVNALEPNVRDYVTAMEARRMNRILKRAISTSCAALARADVTTPDAIITGTCMGCMETSEKFLTDLCLSGEGLLKPTLFMQSTHNTISSMIAIHLKSHGYNMTYSHRGFSFESALTDAAVQIGLGEISTALVGQHDEMTPFGAEALKIAEQHATLYSEGSVSLLLSNNAENAICELLTPTVTYNSSPDEFADKVSEMIATNHVDALIIGNNGSKEDVIYDTLLTKIQPHIPIIEHKKLFGESFSASAFALYVGAEAIRRNALPSAITQSGMGKADIRAILTLNYSTPDGWSAITLKKV
jgi:hypothetical protein